MRTLIIILIFGNFGQLSFAQGHFGYKEIPPDILNEYKFPRGEFDIILNEKFPDAVDLTSYLPHGYSKNGDIDYTSYLQKGIDEHRKVIMPNFPILINSDGLHMRSNSMVLFRQQSQLIILPNSESRYHGILVNNVENLDLYYANIVGDRYTRRSKSGQWGMGIWIKHSRNIKLYNPTVKKCFGDGIYIGNERNSTSEKIIIHKAFLDDNRRNGMSITSGRNVLIEKPFIGNTNGQNPRSGIDIEPNTNLDILENIKINSPITFNNAMHGIVISVGNLAGPLKKLISISINNHIDYFSTIGLGLSMTRLHLEYQNKITGIINISNSVFYSNFRSAVKTYKGTSHLVKLNLNNYTLMPKKLFVKQNQFFTESFTGSLESNIK